jgi:hypothetical protein
MSCARTLDERLRRRVLEHDSLKLIWRGKEKKHFFFWRKRSKKTFINLGCGCSNIPAPDEQTFFAPLFFKKAAACFSLKISGSGASSV